MSNVVEIRGVAKAFGETVVYDGLDLDLCAGETLTVLGPSGVGKSVLLKLIVGLLPADGGSIRVAGVDVVGRPEAQLRDVRRQVGFVFQGAALFDSFTVYENVAYGLREHFDWPELRIAARVAECLAEVGLDGSEPLMPAALSGGMRKRVGLARALAPGPQVILYDEPTTGLDPTNARRIDELIVRLQKHLGVSSLVITHDIDSAWAVSDRVALIEHHRIGLIADAHQARERPPAALARFIVGEAEEAT
jgi:phospholipid/cholesterol/gamma-HCH transport system ATP-binding protein